MGTLEETSPTPVPAAPSAATPAGPDAGSLAVQLLNQLQLQSAQIGQLWQQTQQRFADAELREVALERDRAVLEALRADFERRAADLATQAAQLDERSRDLASRAAADEARTLLLAQRERAMLEREAAPAPAAPADEDALASLRAQLAAAHAATAQREDTLRVLAERLLHAEERALQREAEVEAMRDEQSRAPSDQAGAAPVLSDEGFANALRRARLKRQKQLLATQSRKVVRAKDALARRQAECDLVLAQRAGLVERAAELNAREAALAVQSTRSSGAIIGVCAAAALALVAGLAWTAAGVLAPSRYAAQAVLSAQTPDREPEEGELEAWTASFKELFTDAVVYEQAAEQFGRRAMPTLANPVAVKQRAAEDFSLQEVSPGTLKLEWRGTGAERTARELETYLAGVLSVAETRRHARGDGALTTIQQAPTPGREPLDSRRVEYAAGLTGIGMMLVTGGGLAGFALLRRQDRALRGERPPA